MQCINRFGYRLLSRLYQASGLEIIDIMLLVVQCCIRSTPVKLWSRSESFLNRSFFCFSMHCMCSVIGIQNCGKLSPSKSVHENETLNLPSQQDNQYKKTWQLSVLNV